MSSFLPPKFLKGEPIQNKSYFSIPVILFLFFFFFLFLLSGMGYGFSPQKASFAVRLKDDICPFKVLGVFLLPGEELRLEIDGRAAGIFRLETPGGKAVEKNSRNWQWTAPSQPGFYSLKIIEDDSQELMQVNVFVMVPVSVVKDEYLNGYRIGEYPAKAYRGLPIYLPPRGFVEVTKDNEEILVSPHFKLKQFLCKQDNGNYPQYLILRERLLLKLERILEEVNEKGYPCESLYIFSGFRTPHYNRLIGNGKYSRHVYGGAADIFIDENPRDGMMDDLNKDGKIDKSDADILLKIVEGLQKQPALKKLLGGLAKYPENEKHGPFVHVDTRGFVARWGM